MKDIIIGCYTNYDWEQIKNWAKSIDACGYKGDKAMIVFDSDFATVQTLLEYKFDVYAFNRDDVNQRFRAAVPSVHIVVQRFFHLWEFMNKLIATDRQYDRIITTDVKDVVFQRDPSVYLDQHLSDKKIMVSSESILYKDEPWGNENMANSFPMVYNHMKDRNIWNCGVLAGDFNTMKDLFLNIYLTSISNKVHNPDQAALNVLLSLEPYKSITKFVTSEDGWACQAGTTVDPLKIDSFKDKLLEPEPKWDGEYATTSTGTRHVILHQYDRIPSWKQAIENKYQ